MALSANLKINGQVIENAYISLLKGPQQENVYPMDINGNPLPEVKSTYIKLGAAVSREAWVANERLPIGHRIRLNGHLTWAEAYTELKKMKIDRFHLDLTTAIDA